MKLPTIRAELCRLADLGTIQSDSLEGLLGALETDESALDEVVKSLHNELNELMGAVTI